MSSLSKQFTAPTCYFVLLFYRGWLSVPTWPLVLFCSSTTSRDQVYLRLLARLCFAELIRETPSCASNPPPILIRVPSHIAIKTSPPHYSAIVSPLFATIALDCDASELPTYQRSVNKPSPPRCDLATRCRTRQAQQLQSFRLLQR